MIELLYRIFYVIFAMELAAVFLFPLILFLRLLMQKLPMRYTAWMWRIYFIRILCPIAISSPFCIVAGWNRAYHRILASLGLALEPEQGFLRSWSCVFQNQIHTSLSYQICAFAWGIGMVLLFLGMSVRQYRIRREIRQSAVKLDGRIYQAEVPTPVMTGMLCSRYYLPQEATARQSRYILAHMKAQDHRHSVFWRYVFCGIALLHWFNPLVWCALELAKRDEEMACDELTVKYLGQHEQMPYVQILLNLPNEEAIVPYSGGTIFETNLRKRSAKMLYWRRPTLRQKLTGILILSIFVFYVFLLRPVQIAWANGTWDSGRRMENVPVNLSEDSVIAETRVNSPSGLERIVRLVKKGKNAAGLQQEESFYLQMTDSLGNEIDSRSVISLFQSKELELDQVIFSKGCRLYTGDYNGDGTAEMLIGQQVEWDEPQKTEIDNAIFKTEGSSDSATQKTYVYLVVSLEEQEMQVISEPVYALQGDQMESASPGTEAEIKDLFYVNVPGGRNYYVWDAEQKQYKRQKMTQEELNQHKAASEGTQEEGVAREYTLQDSAGDVVVRVKTESDTTGSQSIRSILIGDEARQTEMERVDGYFCDIAWVTEQDRQSDQYAILTYNGTRAQTFQVYDVERKKLYYSQEDGNQILAETFKKYNGKDITFKDGGVVVYSLLEKNKDVLTINFAADADSGVTVQGNYQYDCEKKTTSNLAFNQTMSNQ